MSGTATVVIGQGASTLVGPNGFRINCASANFLNNLTIDAGGNTVKSTAENLTVKGTLTLTSGIDSIMGAQMIDGVMTNIRTSLGLYNPIAGTVSSLKQALHSVNGGPLSSIRILGTASGVNIPSQIDRLRNLTVDNPSGTTLQGDLRVDTTLACTNGILTTSSNTLTLGPAANLNGEAAGKYVVGNLTTTRSVGTGLSTLGGIGVTIAAGVDDIGNVTVLRVSGAGGIVTANSNQSIARKWTITSDNPPTSGRDLTLKWLSSDDNGKTFSASNKAIVFRYNGSIWVGVGSVKDVSGSDPRSMTVNTTSFSDWTVSDENAPLHVEALNLTALIEGFYDGSTMVSDTVTVELRNTSPGYALVEQAKVVLNTSGNNAAVNFFTAADATNYYIVVKHRNSLQTWSAAGQSFSGGTLSYNFTTAQTPSIWKQHGECWWKVVYLQR